MSSLKSKFVYLPVSGLESPTESKDRLGLDFPLSTYQWITQTASIWPARDEPFIGAKDLTVARIQ